VLEQRITFPSKPHSSHLPSTIWAEDLFECPNDPQAKEGLKQLELILEKHGIKVIHKS